MKRARDFQPLPYYRWYWRDFRASRAVQRLTYIERGIYRELLDECWVSGSIPDNAMQCADIANTPHDIVVQSWHTLRTLFHKRGRRLINERIEQERTRADQLRVEKSLAGQASAVARKAKKNQQPLTPVEQPLTGVEHNSTSSSSSKSRSNTKQKLAARAAAPVENWVATVAGLWERNVGKIQPGRVGAGLKPYHEAHGVDVILQALKLFIAHQTSSGRPCRWDWFVTEATRWCDLALVPVDAVDGEYSSSLELLTRPGVRLVS